MKSMIFNKPFSVFMCIFVLFTAYKTTDSVSSDKTIISIYPTGSYNETYYFEIDSGKTLKAMCGTRNHERIELEKFLDKNSVKSSETIKLEPQDYQQLISLLDKIESDNSIEYNYYTDSWDISIFYNGKCYVTNEPTENENINNLERFIIDISPIDIDLHGWA